MAPLDFPPRSSAELAVGSLHALGLFGKLDLREIDAHTRRFRPGDRIFAGGRLTDRVGLVVAGVVRAGRARLATGQCVGTESLARRFVLRDVMAESSTVILDLPVERFRGWLLTQRWDHPWIGRLAQITRLSDQRLLTVYETDRGTVTVCGDPSRDGVMTMEEDGSLVFVRCRAGAIEHTLRFGDRIVGLVDVERDADGTITEATLARITVPRGTGQHLYRRILERPIVESGALAMFERTGGLDPPASCALLCPCVGVAAEHVVDAESSEEAQRETGAGRVCGGCRPRIDMLVDLRALARPR